jgi:hypothetical protein
MEGETENERVRGEEKIEKRRRKRRRGTPVSRCLA